MKLAHSVIKSTPATGDYPCFFKDAEEIIASLKRICDEWANYLQTYLDQTEALLGAPERPWEDTERAVVSTLSSAIVRAFPTSVLLEEARIKKSGHNGRCDLWVSIPDLVTAGSPFSFYLEAKTTAGEKGLLQLPKFLRSHYGISKIFRDYLKSQSNRIAKLSPYGRKGESRIHEHYVIGMLVTKLRPKEKISDDPAEHLGAIFQGLLKIDITRTDAPKLLTRRRRMGRFPTVAFMIYPEDGSVSGMIATLTVLASSKNLLA